MPNPKFSESLFQEGQARIQKGTDFGATLPQPKFDPKQHAEFQAEQAQGRSIEDYRQMLEYHGFVYKNDVQLIEIGWNPTGSGLWLNAKTEDAFSSDDILSQNVTPKDFDAWFKQHKAKKQLARDIAAGKVDPRERSKILTQL